MAEYDGISEFLKVAPQRIQDARKLLEISAPSRQSQEADTRHLRAVVYIAGYAVECVLKAYIISRQPPAKTLAEAMSKRSKGIICHSCYC